MDGLIALRSMPNSSRRRVLIKISKRRAGMRNPFVLVLLLLTCCATPYQEMGLGGGVDAQKLSSNTYKITAYGNGLSTPALMHEYSMRKAAETTRQAGGTHFVIMRAQDASSMAYVSGAMLSFPGKEFEIRVLTISADQTVPQGAFSATAVLKSSSRKQSASQ